MNNDSSCSMCRYWHKDAYSNYCIRPGQLGAGMNIVVFADTNYDVRFETDPDFYCKSFYQDD